MRTQADRDDDLAIGRDLERKDAEIDRLKKEIATLRLERCEFDKCLRMSAALAPFLAAAKDTEGYPANHPIGCDPRTRLEGLTVADIRNAAAALGHQKIPAK